VLVGATEGEGVGDEGISLSLFNSIALLRNLSTLISRLKAMLYYLIS